MNRYMFSLGLVALASAIYAAVGLLEPARLGWTAPAPIWMKIALGVLLGLPIVWLLAFRRDLQSRWALTDESPVAMVAHVEVDGTAYYVCLRAAPDTPVQQRIAVHKPGGTIDALRTPQAARVFVDGRSGKPLVVELAGHRLWTMVA